GELDVAWLAEQIRLNEGIAALDLAGAGLTTEDVVLICSALEVNTTLEKLDLEGNEICADGLKAIARMLLINKTIRELKIGNQEVVIDTETERILAEAISKNEFILVFTLNIKNQTYWIQIDKALARNTAAYALWQSKKNRKTIYVEETEQVTTTRVNKEITKKAEDDETEEFVVVEQKDASPAVAVAGAAAAVVATVESSYGDASAQSSYGEVSAQSSYSEADVGQSSYGTSTLTDTTVVETVVASSTKTSSEVTETVIEEVSTSAITETVVEKTEGVNVQAEVVAVEATSSDYLVADSAAQPNSYGSETVMVEGALSGYGLAESSKDIAVNSYTTEAASTEGVSTVVESTQTNVVATESSEAEVATVVVSETTTVADSPQAEVVVVKSSATDASYSATDASYSAADPSYSVDGASSYAAANEATATENVDPAKVTTIVESTQTKIGEIAVAGIVVESAQTEVSVVEQTSSETVVVEADVAEVVVVEAAGYGAASDGAGNGDSKEIDAELTAASTDSTTVVETTETVIGEITEVADAGQTEVVASEVMASETVGGSDGAASKTTKTVTTTTTTTTTTTSAAEVVAEGEVVGESSSKAATVVTNSTTVVVETKTDFTLIIVIISVLIAILAVVVVLLLPGEIEVIELDVVESVVLAGDVVPLLFAGAYAFSNVILWVNNDVNAPLAVLPRVVDLLAKTVPVGGLSLVNSTEALDAALARAIKPEETLVFCIGANDCTKALITNETLQSLGSESYHIVTQKKEASATILAVDGLNAFESGDRQPNSMRIQKEWSHGNRGLAYGIYAALEELGFAFLHPLEPSIPPQLSLKELSAAFHESPRWKKFRGIHYHTQHPLELTPFLQGFGPNGIDDQGGWEGQIPEFASFCEWLVANKQNAVEWPLLEGHTWMDWARSDVRIQRLKTIADIAHAYGIMVGMDVPIAFAQQHSFRLLKNGNGKAEHFEEEKKEIEESIDWVMRAGFDFLGTESGTSEFTHSSPETMLAWMNAAADYAAEKYDITMFIKVHCSAGQIAPGFVDPRNQKDINFNMLPHFASSNLGVLPHTVEAYSLDDPAPTYGNKDFKYIREFLNWQLEEAKRPVVFYPETAYWVSVDIDVPLFLPIYFERRFHDLRLIAADEDNSTSKNRMDGQLIFASGWEWGYWLNDALAARSAWNPYSEIKDDKEALRQLLRPLTQHFNSEGDKKDAENLIIEWTTVEKDLLLYGQLEGKGPLDSVLRKNGQGYLQGWDTWDDVSKILGHLTQPDRLGLVEFKHADGWFSHVKDHLWKHKKIDVDAEYVAHIRHLLVEMDAKFADLSKRTSALAAKAPQYTADLWDDIADSARMTALRAHQILSLYEYIHEEKKHGKNRALAKESMATLHTAQEIVNAREKRYRVDAERVAGWTNLNTAHQPTAYAFNYLWTVRSLHYWWRDAAEALNDNHRTESASFANIIDPVEVGIGSGLLLTVAEDVAEFLSAFGVGTNYFDLAEKEPHYPEYIKGWSEP
ncbi:UNVERIFIED_CONTAM: hypothetical protein HDU68_004092, partial [Siphonaria sp. JEL0065]